MRSILVRLRGWRPTRRRLVCTAVALLGAVLAATVAAVLEASQAGADYQGSGAGGPLYAIDAAAQDLVLRSRSPSAYLQNPRPGQQRVQIDPRSIISIVAIDDATLAELGAYNGGYPRSQYAAVVEQLLAAPPRVLAFDIGFFDPTGEDAVLADALEHARRVGTRLVLADVGLLPDGQLQHAADGELLLRPGFRPVAGLAHADELAFANVLPDTRGTIRSMPLLAHIGEQEQPTLGLGAVAAYLRRPQPIDGRSPGNIEVAGREIPVDASSSVLINYFGPPADPAHAAETFPVLSFVDVLRGRIDPSQWRNGIVFLGTLGATGLAEDYWTPVSDAGHKMAGVEIHANVSATLFSTQFLRSAPLGVQALLGFGLAVAVALVAANLGVVLASLVSLALLGLYVLGAVWMLVAFGLLLPLADPLLACLLTFVAAFAFRVVVEQRQARALHLALAAVVPPGVADQIARQPGRIRLGGERRELTILFADLENFTPFAERSDPACVSRVVADFLQTMTAVIFDHGGTVDKFIGDAIMALWNAPLDDPVHAARACSAALAMQAALARLGQTWMAQGLPRQRMRMGLHTGSANVGNFGSHQRFAYTALGDAVNLAARLEPLNVIFGSTICVSEDTLEAAGGSARWLVRYLDRVAVKGRSTPVAVYELLGSAHDSGCVSRYTPLLELYNRGLECVQARQFEAAAELFQAAAECGGVAGADGPSAFYAARCLEYSLDPPAADWDGVFVIRHK